MVKAALTPIQWADFALDPRFWLEHDGEPDDCAQEIAINNAALPDTDPRKITRELVTAMHAVAGGLDRLPSVHELQSLRAFADALASYLPPEVVSEW